MPFPFRLTDRLPAAHACCPNSGGLGRAGADLRGFDHDQCLIAAHAIRGRALLEAQDPYAARPS
jgi:hypothetical protein